MKKNQKGFGLVEGLLIMVIVGLIGFVGWYVYQARNNADNNLNAANSAAASSVAAKPKSKETDAEKQKYIENYDLASPSLQSAFLNDFYDDAKAQCQAAIKDSPSVLNSSTPYIDMVKMVRDDFATAQWCGSGARTILAHLSNGSWKMVASQGMPPACSIVDQYKISKEIAPTCYPDNSTVPREVTYP